MVFTTNGSYITTQTDISRSSTYMHMHIYNAFIKLCTYLYILQKTLILPVGRWRLVQWSEVALPRSTTALDLSTAAPTDRHRERWISTAVYPQQDVEAHTIDYQQLVLVCWPYTVHYIYIGDLFTLQFIIHIHTPLQAQLVLEWCYPIRPKCAPPTTNLSTHTSMFTYHTP